MTGEGVVLAGLRDQLRGNAFKVINPNRIAMDWEDVESDLTIAALTALRVYAHDRGTLPPPQFMTTVIQRRVMHLNRMGRVWWRVVEDLVRQSWADEGMSRAMKESHPNVDRFAEMLVDEAHEAQDERLSAEEQEQAMRALVYALQRNLPPAAFAVLHLRIIEELTPAEIAKLTNIDSNGKVSRRITYAKRKAWELLRSLGIEQWADLAQAAMEDLDG